MRSLGAVILTGSMEVSAAPAAPVEPHLRVPAVPRMIRSISAPLDLGDEVFRYLACGDGSIRPVGGIAVHFCRRGTCRRRPSV